MRYHRLWICLSLVIVISFAVLGYYGGEIYRQAPPVPERVVTPEGEPIWSGSDIKDGQNVWQSIGGQQLGSIWGHGAYVAPDWSADWLHRESLWLLNHWARQHGDAPFQALDSAAQAVLLDRLKNDIRPNTYDPAAKTLTISADRAQAVEAIGRYYTAIFGDALAFPDDVKIIADGGMTPAELRAAYAMPSRTIRDPERQHKLNAFFFWTAWACGAERPEALTPDASATARARRARASAAVTYTNNWPPEPLIDNAPSGPIVVWSVISFVMLLAGIGALAWYYAVIKHQGEAPPETPARDPLLALEPTPSMRATLKYFWVVAALIVAQVGLGAVTAHYGVEGEGFYGVPLAQWLPYAVTRTWHTQLGIFWIATAWLATGLFIAPAISGREPTGQAPASTCCLSAC